MADKFIISELKDFADFPDLETTSSCPFDSTCIDANPCEDCMVLTLSEKDTAFWRSILTGLPSLRILELAIHGKKARTKNKNTNRLVKFWREYEKH